MSTFDELRAWYMLTGGQAPQGGSVSSGGSFGGSLGLSGGSLSGGSLSGGGPSGGNTTSGLPVYAGCEVEPLIGGSLYFQRLKREIEALTGRQGEFVYIAGWTFSRAFSLDGPSGGRPLTDLLKAKAAAGVDVRVLGWVLAPEVLNSSMVQSSRDAHATLAGNASTMLFVQDLRAEPALAHKAVLNILSHPAGAVHCKMVIIGGPNGVTAFTGGIDMHNYRHVQAWHDVQAAVKGPVVQAIYEHYRSMWNEIQSRAPVAINLRPFTYTSPAGETFNVPRITMDSHTHSMPQLPSRTISSPSSGRLHVQSLRTLPQYNFSLLGDLASMVGLLPTNSPLRFAPSGAFENRAARERGIRAAQTYIYIEDQGFWSREVFDWIRETVIANDQIRVVLLIGRWDPNDEPNNAFEKYFRFAVNEHLILGLGPSQMERIGVFRYTNRTVHSKTVIIDDRWAFIGSANSMRRSLYTDIEHSIAFMDEDGVAVPSYRNSLWGEHFHQSFADAEAGLAAWFSLPYQAPGVQSNIVRLRLPFPSVRLTADEEVLYDQIHDPDSRQPWGIRLARHFITTRGAELLSR